uniref:Ctr_32_T conopeptide n=1 Tax=Conus tribblei TaxID=101761 RepID=A0A0C9SEP2_CONTD
MKFPTFVMVLMAAVLLTSILETGSAVKLKEAEAMKSFRARVKAKKTLENEYPCAVGCAEEYPCVDCRKQPNDTARCDTGYCSGRVCYY